MPLYSMTGYARVDGGRGDQRWGWEIKSVNGRGLEPRFRLPTGWDSLEQPARALLAERMRRGSVTISLRMDGGPSVTGFRLNRALLDELAVIVREAETVVESAPPRLDGLLGLKGVLEPIEPGADDEQRAAIEAALLSDFAIALDRLRDGRADEGARLTQILASLLDDIDDLVTRASASDSLRPEMRRERLSRQLAELLENRVPATEERLAQELAMLAVKNDIREEVDRLRAHLAQARDLLKGADAGVGRRLDFLSQEFNREANTLCSKSGDVALTRIGMDLKLAIDRFREQVQNIE